jgi:hypothetical protein
MMNKYVILNREEEDKEEMAYGLLISDGTQVSIDGYPPQVISNIKISPKKTVEDSSNEILKAMGLNPEVQELRIARIFLGIGEYYPRIYRPIMLNAGRLKSVTGMLMIKVVDEEFVTIDSDNYTPIPINQSSYLKSLSSLAILSENLTSIFRIVEPELTNFDVFGHEIRNLLIVACTEVEAQCKAILDANNYATRRLSTNDYVKLLTPLKLAEYEISFPLYPSIPALSPFNAWDVNIPTQSLDWYHAYNATKHDRENNFSQATLSHLVNAIAACAILLIAQFGKRDSWKNELGEFFRVTKAPIWKPEEMYIREPLQKYTSVNYPF